MIFEIRLKKFRLTNKICDTKSSFEIIFKRTNAKLNIVNLKTINVFEKFVNYKYIDERLSRITENSKFRYFFKLIQFKFLNYYKLYRIKNRKRFVHIEIQFVIFYRLQYSFIISNNKNK